VRTVYYTASALKVLRKVEPKRASLFMAKLEEVAAVEPPYRAMNNVTKLKGQDAFRLRVGDWRLIFKVEKTRIDVLAIAPRGSAYDG
jgi:mRNA interferase RelE/StbE